ncbi:WD repeat-containing protein [Cryptosporidium canis]|uniref:WD repeat-containing protein n=1 Tax=Cryptosporidium canis TaxID=195482 RepID=A0ABQ8P6B4_9CRYT|nr:WD repeat-containing protein [Cryptosporidium canis]KAJ1612158.1 WD repeat-containing protein [Cryptosporidium canis]
MSSYKFNNLLGVPYNGGDILFFSESSNLISNVDNRICVHDIKFNRTHVLGCEARSNISKMCLSPDENILICVDQDNYGSIINFSKGLILNRMQFPGSVGFICYSHNGKYVATAVDSGVYIWYAPCISKGWQLILKRKHIFHNSKVNSLDWSRCDRFLLTSSNDMTVRLISVEKIDNFDTVAFVAHKNPVVSAYFTNNMQSIFSVSSEGVIIFWRPSTKKESLGKKAVSPKRILPRQNKSSEIKMPSEDINIDSKTNPSDKITSKYWIEALRAYVNQSKGTVIVGCTFNYEKNLVAISTSNGVFTLYGISVGLDTETMDPDSIMIHSIHTFSLSNSPLTSLKFGANGEWLAVGAAKMGQLIVWEWRSESYILKQQGHSYGIQCSSFSPAGLTQGKWSGKASHDDYLGIGSRTIVATGGVDGKIKLWDISSGYNFATFSDHIAPISKVIFNPQGNAVISASLDGSIRAYDIMRYRNFRTLTAGNDTGVQFTCVAMDRAGELVVAGTQGEDCKIYVWNFQTGKVVDKLSGHTSNIVDIAFCPSISNPGILASASWDGTVRIWDLYARIGKGATGETLVHSSSVLSIAFDPRGNNMLASSSLSGSITFWDISKGTVEGSIDGLRDIHSGRGSADAFSANNSKNGGGKLGANTNQNINRNQHFSSICYSSNGRFLLASSRNSARVCLYDTLTFTLVYTVQLTNSRFFSGIRMELNSNSNANKKKRRILDSENPDEIWNPSNRLSEKEKVIREHNSLPGISVGEFSGPSRQSHFTVYEVEFSQNSSHWIASTSHGAFLFCIDTLGNSYSGTSTHLNMLDSFKRQIMTKEVNVGNIKKLLEEGDLLRGFILALAMNNFEVLVMVYNRIPIASIDYIMQNTVSFLLPNVLNFLRVVTNPTNRQFFRLERHLIWLESIIRVHGNIFMNVNETLDESVQNSKNLMEKESNSEDDKLKQNKLALLSSSLSDCDTKSIFLAILMNISQIYSFSRQVYDSNCSMLHYISLRLVQGNSS